MAKFKFSSNPVNRSTVFFYLERERAIVSFLSSLPQENDLIFILFHYFEFAGRESPCGILIPSAPGTGLIFSPLVFSPTLSGWCHDC